MSGRWFRPSFHVESFFFRSIGWCELKESNINHRSDLSGDLFHEWALVSSKFSCREFLEIYNTREPHHHRSELSGDNFHEWAMILSKFFIVESFLRSILQESHIIQEVSYLETIFMSWRWFRPNFQLESFLRSIIQESHINRRSELSGDRFNELALISSKFFKFSSGHSSKFSCREFLEIYNRFTEVSYLEIFMSGRWLCPSFLLSRVSWDTREFSTREFLEIYNTREPHQAEVSYLETIFMSWRWFRPNFQLESFLRSIKQESHINHRSELSGDHFHELALISFNFQLESFLRSIIQESHINHRSELSGDHFHEWAMILTNFHVESFSRSIKQESHINHRSELSEMSGRWFRPNFHVESFLRFITHFHEWATIFMSDFVQIFMSRVSRDLYYKRATSFKQVSYLETIFMSWRWFRPNFQLESFLRSIIQESHINRRSELSGDRFNELALISFKFSTREFLEIYNTREPHQSEKWAIWRPFSWVGVDFDQIFNSRVSWDL